MLRRLAIVLVVVVVSAAPALAEAGRADALMRTLRLAEVIEIMRAEGMEHGAEIGASLLGPRAGRHWKMTVSGIYGTDRMTEMLGKRLSAALPESDAALDAMIDFFGSERGQRLIELEIGARRAMLDDEIDAAAREALTEMQAADDPRLDRLRRFAEANDLVEENVAGGLNATFAFYMGLLEGGAPEMPMGESEVLADVWAQEAEIRADIEEWLFAFLALAYRPLDDDDLDAYIAFSESTEGQALNAALFAGFNAMFETISRDLGLAAGRLLQGEDI